MDLGDLLRKRLKIAATAAQEDTTTSHSLSNVLSVIVECIHQQDAALELLEAEVADKVDHLEMKQMLGQKLSLKEFLSYFRKVQKIVEKMEAHWAAGESRTEDLITSQVSTLSTQLERSIQLKIQQLSHHNTHEAQLLRMKQQVQALGNGVAQLQCNCQASFLELRSDLQERCGGWEGRRSDDRSEVVLKEVKQMQLYLNETHNQINQLLQNFAKEDRINHQQTEAQLGIRLTNLEKVTQRWKEEGPARWMWELSKASCTLECHALSGLSQLQFLGQCSRGVRVGQTGLFRLTCGYMVGGGVVGKLMLCVQKEQLYSLPMEEGAGSGLLRSCMLYCYLKRGSLVSLTVYCQSSASGFLEVQPL